MRACFRSHNFTRIDPPSEPITNLSGSARQDGIHRTATSVASIASARGVGGSNGRMHAVGLVRILDVRTYAVERVLAQYARVDLPSPIHGVGGGIWFDVVVSDAVLHSWDARDVVSNQEGRVWRAQCWRDGSKLVDHPEDARRWRCTLLAFGELGKGCWCVPVLVRGPDQVACHDDAEAVVRLLPGDAAHLICD